MSRKTVSFLLVFLVALILVSAQSFAAPSRKKTSEPAVNLEDLDEDQLQALLAQFSNKKGSELSPPPASRKSSLASRNWAVGVEGNNILSLRMKLTGFTLDILGRLEMDLSQAGNSNRGEFDLYAGARMIKVFVDHKKIRLNMLTSVS